MTWAPVGAKIYQTSGSFTLTPASAGDLILLFVSQSSNNTVYCTGVSSSNVTWTQLGTHQAGTSNYTSTVWAGRVTSTAGATLTVTWSGTAPANIRISGQEFSSSVGNWAIDGSPGVLNSAGTNTWPSLTPAGAGELYCGYVLAGAAVAGSTPGYTYSVDANGNGFAYNPACTAAAQAPVWGDSTQSMGQAVLMREVSGLGLVQSAQGSGAGPTLTLTLPNPTGLNRGLVVLCCASGTTTSPTVSGITLGGSADNFVNRSGTVGSTSSDPAVFSVWDDLNCAAGQTSVAITFSGGSGTLAIFATVMERDDLPLSGNPLDQIIHNVIASSATYDSTATPTTTQAAEAWMGMAFTDGTSTITIGSPGGSWTTLAQMNQTLGSLTGSAQSSYQTVAATGTAQINGTLSGTTESTALAVTYKLAVAAVITSSNAASAIPPGFSPMAFTRVRPQAQPSSPPFSLANNFANGTQAAAITSGNSGTSGNAFDATGSGATYDNTHVLHTSMSALLTHTSGTLSAPYAAWLQSMGMQGTAWFRFYLFATANPTVDTRIWQCHSGASGGLSCALTFQTTGKLKMAGQVSTFTTSTMSVPFNQWLRLEGFVVGGSPTTGQSELRIYTSNADNPLSAYDEIDTSTPNQNTNTSLPDRYIFGDWSGTTETATWSYWMADIGLSNGGYLGPTGTPSTPVTQADVAAAAESPFSITVTVPWADAAGAADAETVAAAVPVADAAGAADAVVPAAAVPVADAAGAADAVSVTGLPLDNSAEGGTNGVTVTQANSGGSSGAAWDNVGNTNGTAQYSTARAMHGTTSYYFATSATAGVGYAGWSPTSVKTPTQVAGGRAYVNFTGNPAAPDANIQIKGTGSSTAGNIQVDTSGHIVAQTPGFASAFTFTNALSLNTWYRIEWAMTCGAAGSASMAVSLFAGDSTTVIETHTDTTNAWGGTGGVAECDFGWTNSHANQPGLYMDDMDLNAVGMPGPSTGPTPVSQADAAAATDTMVPAAAVPLPETAGAAETLSVSATAALSDAAAVTDQLTVSAAVSLPDAAASADAIAPPAAAVPLTERGAAAESQVIGIPQSDVSGAADAISVSVAASLPDTAGAAESQAIGLPQADAAGAADALTVTAAVPAAEVAAAADTLAVTAAASLAETAGAADALTVSGTSSPALPDVAGGADTVTVAAAVTMPDSGSGVDAVAATVTASLTDTAAASDAISRVVGTNPADTAGAADALTVTASVSLPEQAAGSDVFSVAGSAAPALPDLGAATDQISTAASTAAADAAAGADQLTAAVAVSLPELAGAAETLTVAVSVSVPDAGAASDTVTSGEGALLADSAAAADALHVAVTTALADAGAAPDQLAVSATATLADVASAADACVTQTVIFKTGTVEWAVSPDTARWHTEPLTGRWLVKASAPRWQAEPVEGRWSTQPELARWRVSMDDFEAVSALSPEMINIRWTSDLDGTTIDPTSQPLVVQFAMPVSSGNVFAPAQPAQWYPASWLTGGKGKGFVQQCPVGPLTAGPTLTPGVKYDVWAKIVGGTPESPVKFAGVLSVY